MLVSASEALHDDCAEAQFSDMCQRRYGMDYALGEGKSHHGTVNCERNKRPEKSCCAWFSDR